MSTEKIDRLVLHRSQPVQGQQVHVVVEWNNAKVGELELPFGAWLKVKRLLEKGIEMDGRENYALQLKLSVQGIDAAPAVAGPTGPAKILLAVGKRKAAPVVELDDDDDADIAAAEAAAKQDALADTVARSLRTGGQS